MNEAAFLEQAAVMTSHILELGPASISEASAYLDRCVTWSSSEGTDPRIGHKAVLRALHALPRSADSLEDYRVQSLSGDGCLVQVRAHSSQMESNWRLQLLFALKEDGPRCVHIFCTLPNHRSSPEEAGAFELSGIYRKAQERELWWRRHTMNIVLSSSRSGLAIISPDGTHSFIYVSPEAAALAGYTLEEFLQVSGGNALGLVYPADREALAAAYDAVLSGERHDYSVKYRIPCKDGSLKWILENGKLTKAPDKWTVIASFYQDITSVEEDQQRIHLQSELLKSIYDSVPCGIIRFARMPDGTSRLISVNRAAVRLLGYQSRDEALQDWQDGIFGTVMEEDAAYMRTIYALLRQIGDRRDSEYRACWRDGSIHWMDGTCMLVDFTAEGCPVIQRTLVDITMRKELQLQLNREQELYRAAMEAGSSITYEYLMEEDLFISHSLQFGSDITRQKVPHYSKQLRTHQIVHPDDVRLVLENLCQGRTGVFEVRLAIPESNGTQYRRSRVTTKLLLQDGVPSKVVGTIQSIPDLHDGPSPTQEFLQMTQSALQAISQIYLYLYYVDLSNDRFFAIRTPAAASGSMPPRGGRFSTVLSRLLCQDVIPEDAAAAEKVFDPVWLSDHLSEDAPPPAVEFRRKAGSGGAEEWLRLSVHLVSQENGSPRTVIMACQDITAQKQQELARQEKEQRAKQALMDAYEAARKANLAKSDFLSRISHDIRTPMNAVLGMAAVAERNPADTAQVRSCLSMIRASGSLLLSLINDILDMSKLETGGMQLHESAFHLCEMVRDTAGMLSGELNRMHQHLSLCLDAVKHDAVLGDRVRVQQILLNLLSNASKYTPQGGHIRVALEEKLSSQSGTGCFVLVVEDDGIGMSPDFLDRMFEPFERATDPRVTPIPGSGLGLSITKNLVHMMNGSIQVRSHPDEGTRFEVTIYLKLTSEAPEAPASGARPSPKKAHSPFLPGLRILAAEDNLVNQEVLRKLLSTSGLEIDCVQNGQLAVDRFRQAPPDTYHLILMDIQMPVMNGYEATRAIRALASDGRPDAAEIPIIALSANTFADDVYRAKQAGMNEHITKPLNVEALMQTLHRWLDK